VDTGPRPCRMPRRCNCLLRRRYTDFLVNEILPNGQVLHLTNLGVLPKKELEKSNEKSDVTAGPASQGAQPAVGAVDEGA